MTRITISSMTMKSLIANLAMTVIKKAKRLVALLPPENWRGGIRRQCPVCDTYFDEKKVGHATVRRLAGGRGPQGWMR